MEIIRYPTNIAYKFQILVKKHNPHCYTWKSKKEFNLKNHFLAICSWEFILKLNYSIFFFYSSITCKFGKIIQGWKQVQDKLLKNISQKFLQPSIDRTDQSDMTSCQFNNVYITYNAFVFMFWRYWEEQVWLKEKQIFCLIMKSAINTTVQKPPKAIF